MGRHAERNNLILCAVLVKLRRCVAIMAVEDKKSVGAGYTRLCTAVEVLKPGKAELICRPAIIADSDYLAST